MLKETIKEFESKQRNKYHFDNEQENYHYIIDLRQSHFIRKLVIVKGSLRAACGIFFILFPSQASH